MSRLDEHLERLFAIFPAASDRSVLLAEASRMGWRRESVEVRRSDLHTRDEYAGRFDELMHSGFGWINLNLFGWLGGAALFVVELPHASVGCPVERVSVNLSGPRMGANDELCWDATERVHIVEDIP